jgi:Tol biopolymer transport system component
MMRVCPVCGAQVDAESRVCPTCQSNIEPVEATEQATSSEGPGEPEVLLVPGAGLERWEHLMADTGRRRQTRVGLRVLAVVVLVVVNVLAWQTFVHGSWGMRLSTLHQILFAGGSNDSQGAFDAGAVSPLTTQLYTMHPDGSGLRRLTDPATGSYFSPAWSPDGTHLAAFRFSTIGESATLVIMQANGSHLQEVPAVQLSLNSLVVGNGVVNAPLTKLISWSPDGSQLIAPTGQDSYLIVNADGTRPRQIDGDRPTWAPDSRHVAFYGPNQGGPIDNVAFAPFQLTGGPLIILDTQTLQSHELPPIDNLSDGALAWSPDGRYLAATTWKLDEQQNLPIGGVLILPPDGSDQHQVIQWTGGEADQLSWSPDGSKLAAMVVKSVSLDTFGGGLEGPLETDLWVVNSDSTAPRNLGPCDTDAPAWSPDGRQVLVVRYKSDQALRQMLLEDVGAAGTSEHDLSASLSASAQADLHYVFAPSWSPI